MVCAFVTEIGIVLGLETVAGTTSARSEGPSKMRSPTCLWMALEHTDRRHGRDVLQHLQVIENIKQVDAGTWADCKRLGRVVSLRVEGDKRQVIETRYYTSSTELTHEQLYAAVRQEWGIENRLYWSLDVIFREDDAKSARTTALAITC